AAACNLRMARICGGRRPNGVRPNPSSDLSPAGRADRPGPQGRVACGAAGIAGDKARAGDQLEDREGAWPHRATLTDRPSRRGDRMKRREFIALVGSAVACPRAAPAQQSGSITLPKIGFLLAGNLDHCGPACAAWQPTNTSGVSVT